MRRKSNRMHGDGIDVNLTIEGLEGTFETKAGSDLVDTWTSTDREHSVEFWVSTLLHWGLDKVDTMHYSPVGTLVRYVISKDGMVCDEPMSNLVERVLAGFQQLTPSIGNLFVLKESWPTSRILTSVSLKINEAYNAAVTEFRRSEWQEMMEDLDWTGINKSYDILSLSEEEIKTALFADIAGTITDPVLRIFSTNTPHSRISLVLTTLTRSEASPITIKHVGRGAIFATGKSGKTWYVGRLVQDSFEPARVVVDERDRTHYAIPLCWADLGVTPRIVHEVKEDNLEAFNNMTPYSEHFSCENDAVRFTMSYLDELFARNGG